MRPSTLSPDKAQVTAITNQVRVSVISGPRLHESRPDKNSFAFSYTVTLENLSDSSVQLLQRHWYVLSADKQIAEVVGPGVIGVQPILEPGAEFTYTSGSVIQDPVGAMYGIYTFANADGDLFEVDIPRFELLFPNMLH